MCSAIAWRNHTFWIVHMEVVLQTDIKADQLAIAALCCYTSQARPQADVFNFTNSLLLLIWELVL